MDPISILTIAPLLSFTRLKFVSFTSLFGFNLDDETVDAMARSWKDLEKLKVGSFWQPQPPQPLPPRTTWKSLVSMAKHNPRLEELTLPFDATTITEQLHTRSSVIPWKDIRNDALQTLDVCRSPIDCPSVVAQLISDLFPNLERISVTPELEQKKDSRNGKWAEVEELLRVAKKKQVPLLW